MNAEQLAVHRAFQLAGLRLQAHFVRILVTGMAEYECGDAEILASAIEVQS